MKINSHKKVGVHFHETPTFFMSHLKYCYLLLSTNKKNDPINILHKIRKDSMRITCQCYGGSTTYAK